MWTYISSLHFASPYFLLGLLFNLILAIWCYKNIRKHKTFISYAHIGEDIIIKTWKTRLYPYMPLLFFLALSFFVIALARPQINLKEEKVTTEGIDIVMAMDISSSMLAKDFEPNRLEVSKIVAKEFVEKRPYDRIGLVVFSGEAFTMCPVTTDHRVVSDFLRNLQIGMVEDGTAIGMGLATSVNRIKDSQVKSKVVILLTDGVNNSGYISPVTATDIAVEFGVKVYTIAIGSMGTALVPMNMRNDGTYYYGMGQVEIDIELLQEIAEKTGGKFFRATDRESLENIYSEIDRLEKSEIDMSVFKRYKDEYRLFLSLGFISLILYFVFKNSIFRTLN